MSVHKHRHHGRGNQHACSPSLWGPLLVVCCCLTLPAIATATRRDPGQQQGTCSPCVASLTLDSLGSHGGGTGPPRYRVHRHEPQPFGPLRTLQHAVPDLQLPTDYLIQVHFFDSYWSEGWDRLQITVNPKIPIPDEVKAHAAGFAEAFFSADEIYNYWDNYRRNEYQVSEGQPHPELLDWVDTQVTRLRKKVASESENSKYFRLMGLVLAQFDGLVEGYQHTITDSRKNLTWHELYLLQSLGDLYDLNVLFPPQPPSPPSPPPAPDIEPDTPDSSDTPHSQDSLTARSGPTQGSLTSQETDTPDSLSARGQAAQGITDADRSQRHRTASTRASDGNSGTAESEGQDRGGTQESRRRYTPGHGILGDSGTYGEFLECSALIKIDNTSFAARYVQRTAELEQNEMMQAPWFEARSAVGQRAQDSGCNGSYLSRVLQRVVAAWQWLMSGGRRLPEPAQAAAAAATPWLSRRKHRCSGAARVKWWAGHTTWRPYYAMRRTWKVYDFPWSETGPVVISSSPGFLHSKDDWYTTDRFLVMETTNGIYNKSLYDYISPACALTWQRAMIANYGATSGSEWIQLFQKDNSGTYNNQWMVLDVEALQGAWLHDVLWILEQIPGRVVKADVTSQLLSQGYWASYNVPFFREIYNTSGYPLSEDMWVTAPRARIFAREIPNIKSISDVKKLIRYNRYQKDPLSEGKPNNAIASRYDLQPVSDKHTNWTRKAFGAVDGKAVDTHSFDYGTTHVICGPTTDDQPPFRWSSSGLGDIAHTDTVDQYTFAWQQYGIDNIDT